MSILAVGSVAFDSVKTPFGEVERAVGGSATYFSLSASFFTDVAVVGVVGEDFTEEHFAILHEKGIDTRQIQRKPGKSFFWKGEYLDMNEAKTHATELNVFAEFRPEIHPDFRKSPVLFLGNIDPDLQLHVLEQVETTRLIGLDSMNLWIDIRRASLEKVISRSNIFFVNDGEARMLSGERNLVTAARKLRQIGVRSLVIKRGEYGVMTMVDDDIFMLPAFPVPIVRDTTGAGDTFAGGFMGYLAKMGELTTTTVRMAAVYGTIMASFNVEDFSVNSLRDLTFPEIEDRKATFLRMIRV